MKKAIICDIDGTLAIMDPAIRGPYEYHKSDKDSLNVAVATILHSLSPFFEIIIVSGREDISKEMTLRWLQSYKVPFNQLHMRKAKDNRPDNIVKREIYDDFIDGKYEVLFVLDDRDQVVRMWRDDLHLTCMQVAWGNF